MPETCILDVGSAKLEVDVYAEEGPLVCLLPGQGGGIRRFEQLGHRLAAAGWRPVAINPRGAGESEGPLEGLTLHDLAGDVAGVVESLGDGPAVLIGNAFGNRLARCVAADRPDLVACIVLVCAGGKVPPDPIALKAMLSMNDASLSDEELAEAARLSLFAEGSEVPEWFVRDNRSPKAAAAQGEALRRTDTADWWTGGSTQILVVQGMDDKIAPPENGHLLRAELPGRVLVEDIPDAGHAVLFEKPAEVASAILAFLTPYRG